MPRLNLADDQWADLREPRNVPERLRRPILRLQADVAGSDFVKAAASDEQSAAGSLSGEAIDLMSRLNDLVVLALVSAWSFEFPVSEDGLLELPGWAYDGLRKHCSQFLGDLLPDFGPNPEPGSPTEPSAR